MRSKLAFIGRNTLDAVADDAKFCAEHGFEGLEYNYWADFEQLETETVRKMRRIHSDHGVKCVMLGIWGWNFLSPDEQERAKARRMLEKAVELAGTLQAEVLTLGAGVFSQTLEENVAEFLNVFPAYLQKLTAAGLKPAFYAMHGKSFFTSIEAYERVWEHLPQVGIKYDPANWRHHGADYLDVVRRHGDKIAHVHIKEHLYHQGELASQPAAGMGDIEWGKVFAFLYEHGYNGALSVEPHGPVWTKGRMRHTMLLLTQRAIAPYLI